MNEQQFHLTVSKGPELGRVIELTSVTMTIGRDPLSEIMINDPEVSRRHARLVATQSGYQIQDLGSTNGTFVDGVRLGGEPVDLQPGQVITIGAGVALTYQAPTIVDEPASPMPGEEPEELESPQIVGEPEPVSDEMVESEFVESEFDASTTLFSEEIEDDYGSAAELKLDDSDDWLSDDSSTAAPTPEISHDDEELSEDADQAESYEAAHFSDPVVIPHEGEPAPAQQNGQGSNYRRLSIIIASVLLVLLCCCCGLLLFFYYVGGDWLLRQMGLLP